MNKVEAILWVVDARNLKELVTKCYGPKCEEFCEDCVCCIMHKNADINLESANEMLNEVMDFPMSCFPNKKD